MQFLIYVFIGGAAALINLAAFLVLMAAGGTLTISAPTAFVVAALTNYVLCVKLLFHRKARWNATLDIVVYGGVVVNAH